MAEETATLTMEQELDALLNPAAPKAPEPDKGATPEAGTEPPPSASGEGAPPEDPLLKALDEIKEDEPAKEEPKSALTSEQQQVLTAIPDAKTAEYLLNVHNAQVNFQNTLESGDFAKTEAMFKDFSPSAYDKLLEGVYEKYVASGEWVDRFIAEKEGRGQEHSALKSVQKELNDLKNQLNEKKTVSSADAAKEADRKAFAGYGEYITKLFDQINFNPADREYVTAKLNATLATDPALIAEIRKGNYSAVNKTFKATLKGYITRDKQVKGVEADKVKAQEQKKAPVGGGAAAIEDPLPEDIRQVPKGKEDSWAKQQLDRLFAKKK